MKRLLFIFSFFFLFVLNGKTQEVEILTLEDCLRIGIDNNLSLEGKRKEIQRSKYGVSENRSKLLPHGRSVKVTCSDGLRKEGQSFATKRLFI